MKTAVEYLRERGLLKDGFNKFVVSFEDGEQFDVVELIEEYASQPKWISVEERLPEEYEWVIGCNDEDKRSYQTRLEVDGKWIRDRNVTHWQPLPTPLRNDN